ncbi:unnamed protein product [Hymenolepis diminuta]|uniref:Uncharacterized protein n=1 Tax=Hymenolepis diminuta TaxID=6216 RepID=A0A564YBS3_HYMDI|nr:unnamed protein product [Hymenolepis diminuta]
MLASLTSGLDVLSVKFHSKKFSIVLNVSTATVSHTSTSNSAKTLVLLVCPTVILTATLLQAANNNMKSQQSVRESVKMSNSTHSTKSTKPIVAPVKLVLVSAAPKQQPVQKSCLLNHYAT